jgi:hypothetical protein
MRTGRIAALGAIALLGTSPAPANPPTLTGLFPAGAARGQAVTVEALGTFDHWPVQAWCESRGVAIRAEAGKGKLSIAVAADAEPGVRWVRLYDEEGATSLRPFLIGVLPEVLEVEPNDDPQGPQRLVVASATVNGRLTKPGDVDGFAVPLQRGQTLVADVEANRHLGSPMDAVLQVVSPEGFVLAQNDDEVGRDPRLVFPAPTSGPYLIRLFAFPDKPDSSIRFAGGPAFIYRLTLTTGGFLEYPFPLAVGRDGPEQVEAVGWNITGAARLLPVPPGQGRGALPVFHPGLAGTFEIRRVPFAAMIEAEPNDPARPRRIPNRVAISGRIDPPGDQDAFQVALKKGERRTFRIESRALGLPLDPVLRLFDASGRLLAEADDDGRNNRDPERAFTAPADGDYRVAVRDLNGRGGPRFSYLLNVLAPEPDFALTLAADRFDVTPGKTTKVAVAIRRRDGHAEPIEIVAEDLPDGVSARPATSKLGDASARSVTLELSAEDCACPGPFRIVGRAGRETEVSRMAAIAGLDAKTALPWVTIHPRNGGTKK